MKLYLQIDETIFQQSYEPDIYLGLAAAGSFRMICLFVPGIYALARGGEGGKGGGSYPQTGRKEGMAFQV